jgi:methylmalonyl-CoA mutase cobalamin-binding subunit
MILNPKPLTRAELIPEQDLPDATWLMDQGKQLATMVTVGKSPFLSHYQVMSEKDYKQHAVQEGRIMLHAQVGYRSLDKSRRAFAEIYHKLEKQGYRIDRFGICLDWSMGYPASMRRDMPQGTGLIIPRVEDFIALTHEVPVAPHFGDFVLGTPASLENTCASLLAGSTSIGNMGQYFTFRMPNWQDDVGITAETVKSIALCAAQPVDILIHSNLDDGFASIFTDMACSIGSVLLEQYIVDELIGGQVSHCYGHTYSDPMGRLAFQRALTQVSVTPGTMVYGNTMIYVEDETENYANLGSYLLVDIVAQQLLPSGHGLNPVPVTEAMRIPEIIEIVEAHTFANRLIQRAVGFEALFDIEKVDVVTRQLIEGGRLFKQRVLDGLLEAGIDISNPLEMLLAIRRLGARRLETYFGPGEPAPDQIHQREPLVKTTTLASLENQAAEIVKTMQDMDKQAIAGKNWIACVTCTDVHEYGKLLVESVLRKLGIKIVDAGVSVDVDDVARIVKEEMVDFLAISTYNGVAFEYLKALRAEMMRDQVNIPIFIGGKLNQIMDDSSNSLPVDVSDDLEELGGLVCHRVEDMLERLLEMTRE